jgi:hypothetical protein
MQLLVWFRPDATRIDRMTQGASLSGLADRAAVDAHKAAADTGATGFYGSWTWIVEDRRTPV